MTFQKRLKIKNISSRTLEKHAKGMLGLASGDPIPQGHNPVPIRHSLLIHNDNAPRFSTQKKLTFDSPATQISRNRLRDRV
ncbi:hypothetical protein [Burkholderia ubonensis]|uniref:hypothetical protein n=1 Tax=Burkholderia ubonensis TaxID=101571 RepID=UPI000AD1CD98|nr:hypothetical protein [Burkholderia ubonensis]